MTTDMPQAYFKKYRAALGFSSQGVAKDFLAAKNIPAGIDYDYVSRLNERISEIISRLNKIVHPKIRIGDVALKSFLKENVEVPFEKIDKNKLLPRLNNQGRRPEEVLFSWLRGYAVTNYFTPALSHLLGVTLPNIKTIGDDDYRAVETFRRTPTADLEVAMMGRKLRIEVQSGFQGVNDIKEHKVREAKRFFHETRNPTLCVHFDLFNGQAALVRLDSIEDTDVNWVTRQQMEGQSVFAIDQNYFIWRLLDDIPAVEWEEVLA